MSRKDWNNAEIVERLLKNKTKKAYWENIWELRRRATRDVFDKCVELIHAHHAKERCIGIDVLAILGVHSRPFLKETLKLYFEILETEKDDEIIGSTLTGIGHNNGKLSKAQVKTIASFKNHAASFVRQGVMHALLGVSNSMAIDTLIYLMDDKVTYIRNWATFGIGDLIEANNETIIAALQKRIHDKDGETRGEAIYGLAKRKVDGIEEIVKQELLNKNHDKQLLQAFDEMDDIQISSFLPFLPLLEKDLKKMQRDKNNQDPAWLEELTDCIRRLNESKNRKDNNDYNYFSASRRNPSYGE